MCREPDQGLSIPDRGETPVASTLQSRAAGLATAMAGLLFVLFGLVYYCFTHGSTGEGRNGTLFGMGYADYSRM
jgi:hypothetical protein